MAIDHDFRTQTRSGTIELAVSEDTAARSGIGDWWEKIERPTTPEGWSALMQKRNEADAARDRRKRKKEASMASLELDPDTVPEPPTREIDKVAARAMKAGPQPADQEPKPLAKYPYSSLFFMARCQSFDSRQRGTPGNTAPRSGKGAEN
jgi:hypothetical protein